MKINKIFMFATLASAALFTACSDKDDYSGPGEWNATADYANIYFKQASKTESVDPTDPTTATFQVYRRVQHEYVFGKDSVGNIIPDSIVSDKILTALPARTVKLEIIENTNNVFKISDATFAENDTVATVNVTYDGAEVGIPHVLKVSSSDPALVSYYSKDITFTYTVTRVKWNLLGKGTYEDNYYIGTSGEAEIYQRDDNPKVFRVMHPLDEVLAKAKANTDSWDAAEFNGKQPEYIELTVDKNGIVTFPAFNSGCYNLNYSADVLIIHPMDLSSTAAASNWTHNKVLSYQADGKTPGQIQLAPWYYMNGVGGWNQSQADGIILITFPGYTPVYTATVEDFEWEEEFSGIYTSTQLGTKRDKVKLFKGVPNPELAAAEEGCYDRFAEAYGTPYYIEAPYAEGCNVVFCVKDGKIIAPEGYESQPLGFKAVGQDVYGAVTTKDSYFGDIQIDLNISFQNKSGSVVYGNAVETLLNFVYTKDMVLGTFNYKGVLASNGNEYDLGNFTIVEHPTEADSLILKDFYLEGAEVPARVDLNEGKIFVEHLAYIGIEEDEGTPYYIFTYSKSGADDIEFDINTDGTLTSTDLILVGSPDLQNLYYWFNSSHTTFVPVKDAANARKASFHKKANKKGAKLNKKGLKLSIKK